MPAKAKPIVLLKKKDPTPENNPTAKTNVGAKKKKHTSKKKQSAKPPVVVKSKEQMSVATQSVFPVALCDVVPRPCTRPTVRTDLAEHGILMHGCSDENWVESDMGRAVETTSDKENGDPQHASLEDGNGLHQYRMLYIFVFISGAPGECDFSDDDFSSSCSSLISISTTG